MSERAIRSKLSLCALPDKPMSHVPGKVTLRYRYAADLSRARSNLVGAAATSSPGIVNKGIDFVVVERRIPVLMIKAKWGDQDDVDRGLRYLKAKFPGVPAWQLSAVGRKDYVTPEGISVSPALPFLSQLI